MTLCRSCLFAGRMAVMQKLGGVIWHLLWCICFRKQRPAVSLAENRLEKGKHCSQHEKKEELV
jgi:hypothetical protein